MYILTLHKSIENKERKKVSKQRGKQFSLLFANKKNEKTKIRNEKPTKTTLVFSFKTFN